MAESVEHSFLSEVALDVMQEAANSRLFTCKESGRKRFDFSCDLTRDWTRVVSGQTLWKHDRDGIDKDIRTLLTDDEASAVLYVVRDSTASRMRIEEIIADYRKTPLVDTLPKLRVFPVSADFDADNERDRSFIRATLRRDIHRDLLMKVVLGGLTARDVKQFVGSGRIGDSVKLLSGVNEDGCIYNYTHASKRYGMGVPALKEELLRLELTEMIERRGLLQITDKGRAMLEICRALSGYLSGESEENPDLLYICNLLGADSTHSAAWSVNK